MSNLFVKINQGYYDSERDLLVLRKNAIREKNVQILDAVHQRLKIHHQTLYRVFVGPVNQRVRDDRFKCYCNRPKPLCLIYKDIMSGEVPYDSLTCDACWKDDICTTWGYYGCWGKKLIPLEAWRELCLKRSDYKFVY